MGTRLPVVNAKEAANENLIINNMAIAINEKAFAAKHDDYMEKAVSYIKKPGMMGILSDIPSLKFHNVRTKIIPTSRGTGTLVVTI